MMHYHYIAERNGPHFVAINKGRTELKAVERELAELELRIIELESRKAELQRLLRGEKKLRRSRR